MSFNNFSKTVAIILEQKLINIAILNIFRRNFLKNILIASYWLLFCVLLCVNITVKHHWNIDCKLLTVILCVIMCQYFVCYYVSIFCVLLCANIVIKFNSYINSNLLIVILYVGVSLFLNVIIEHYLLVDCKLLIVVLCARSIQLLNSTLSLGIPFIIIASQNKTKFN